MLLLSGFRRDITGAVYEEERCVISVQHMLIETEEVLAIGGQIGLKPSSGVLKANSAYHSILKLVHLKCFC